MSTNGGLIRYGKCRKYQFFGRIERRGASMIQEVVIEKESLEYYEYLDQKCRKIAPFLGKADGSVNPMKVHMFLSLAAVPFSSWANSGKEPTEIMKSPRGTPTL